MLTMHRRAQYRTTNGPHARYYRACANDPTLGEDDALRAARGIVNALIIGAAIWALLGVGVWALSMLWAQ